MLIPIRMGPFGAVPLVAVPTAPPIRLRTAVGWGWASWWSMLKWPYKAMVWVVAIFHMIFGLCLHGIIIPKEGGVLAIPFMKVFTAWNINKELFITTSHSCTDAADLGWVVRINVHGCVSFAVV